MSSLPSRRGAFVTCQGRGLLSIIRTLHELVHVQVKVELLEVLGDRFKELLLRESVRKLLRGLEVVDEGRLLVLAAAAVGGGTRAHRYEDRAGVQVVRKPSYALAEPQR